MGNFIESYNTGTLIKWCFFCDRAGNNIRHIYRMSSNKYRLIISEFKKTRQKLIDLLKSFTSGIDKQQQLENIKVKEHISQLKHEIVQIDRQIKTVEYINKIDPGGEKTVYEIQKEVAKVNDAVRQEVPEIRSSDQINESYFNNIKKEAPLDDSIIFTYMIYPEERMVSEVIGDIEKSVEIYESSYNEIITNASAKENTLMAEQAKQSKEAEAEAKKIEDAKLAKEAEQQKAKENAPAVVYVNMTSSEQTSTPVSKTQEEILLEKLTALKFDSDSKDVADRMNKVQTFENENKQIYDNIVAIVKDPKSSIQTKALAIYDANVKEAKNIEDETTKTDTINTDFDTIQTDFTAHYHKPIVDCITAFENYSSTPCNLKIRGDKIDEVKDLINNLTDLKKDIVSLKTKPYLLSNSNILSDIDTIIGNCNGLMKAYDHAEAVYVENKKIDDDIDKIDKLYKTDITDVNKIKTCIDAIENKETNIDLTNYVASDCKLLLDELDKFTIDVNMAVGTFTDIHANVNANIEAFIKEVDKDIKTIINAVDERKNLIAQFTQYSDQINDRIKKLKADHAALVKRINSADASTLTTLTDLGNEVDIFKDAAAGALKFRERAVYGEYNIEIENLKKVIVNLHNSSTTEINVLTTDIDQKVIDRRNVINMNLSESAIYDYFKNALDNEIKNIETAYEDDLNITMDKLYNSPNLIKDLDSAVISTLLTTTKIDAVLASITAIDGEDFTECADPSNTSKKITIKDSSKPKSNYKIYRDSVMAVINKIDVRVDDVQDHLKRKVDSEAKIHNEILKKVNNIHGLLSNFEKNLNEIDTKISKVADEITKFEETDDLQTCVTDITRSVQELVTAGQIDVAVEMYSDIASGSMDVSGFLNNINSLNNYKNNIDTIIGNHNKVVVEYNNTNIDIVKPRSTTVVDTITLRKLHQTIQNSIINKKTDDILDEMNYALYYKFTKSLESHEINVNVITKEDTINKYLNFILYIEAFGIQYKDYEDEAAKGTDVPYNTMYPYITIYINDPSNVKNKVDQIHAIITDKLKKFAELVKTNAIVGNITELNCDCNSKDNYRTIMRNTYSSIREKYQFLTTYVYLYENILKIDTYLSNPFLNTTFDRHDSPLKEIQLNFYRMYASIFYYFGQYTDSYIEYLLEILSFVINNKIYCHSSVEIVALNKKNSIYDIFIDSNIIYIKNIKNGKKPSFRITNFAKYLTYILSIKERVKLTSSLTTEDLYVLTAEKTAKAVDIHKNNMVTLQRLHNIIKDADNLDVASHLIGAYRKYLELVRDTYNTANGMTGLSLLDATPVIEMLESVEDICDNIVAEIDAKTVDKDGNIYLKNMVKSEQDFKGLVEYVEQKAVNLSNSEKAKINKLLNGTIAYANNSCHFNSAIHLLRHMYKRGYVRLYANQQILINDKLGDPDDDVKYVKSLIVDSGTSISKTAVSSGEYFTHVSRFYNNYLDHNPSSGKYTWGNQNDPDSDLIKMMDLFINTNVTVNPKKYCRLRGPHTPGGLVDNKAYSSYTVAWYENINGPIQLNYTQYDRNGINTNIDEKYKPEFTLQRLMDGNAASDVKGTLRYHSVSYPSSSVPFNSPIYVQQELLNIPDDLKFLVCTVTIPKEIKDISKEARINIFKFDRIINVVSHSIDTDANNQSAHCETDVKFTIVGMINYISSNHFTCILRELDDEWYEYNDTISGNDDGYRNKLKIDGDTFKYSDDALPSFHGNEINKDDSVSLLPVVFLLERKTNKTSRRSGGNVLPLLRQIGGNYIPAKISSFIVFVILVVVLIAVIAIIVLKPKNKLLEFEPSSDSPNMRNAIQY